MSRWLLVTVGLVVGLVLLLVVTKPDKAGYVALLHDELAAKAPGWVGENLAAAAVPIVVDACTTVRDCVFFSVFTTCLEGSYHRYLGILGRFFPFPGRGETAGPGVASPAASGLEGRESWVAPPLPGGGWGIEYGQLIRFPAGPEYLVLAASRPCEPGAAQFLEGQVFVCKRTLSGEAEWELMWQSPLLDWLGTMAFHGLHTVIRPDVALVVPEFNLGGARGLSHIMVLSLVPGGRVALEAELTIGSGDVRVMGDAVVAVGEEETGTHVFLAREGRVVGHFFPRSQMAPAGAREVKFVLTEREGKRVVVPAGDGILQARVGEVIAFVPGDEATALAFDQGHITIYTDAWNGPPLTFCEANRLSVGNSYRLTIPGVFHFALVHSDYWRTSLSTEQEGRPTFVVNVRP